MWALQGCGSHEPLQGDVDCWGRFVTTQPAEDNANGSGESESTSPSHMPSASISISSTVEDNESSNHTSPLSQTTSMSPESTDNEEGPSVNSLIGEIEPSITYSFVCDKEDCEHFFQLVLQIFDQVCIKICGPSHEMKITASAVKTLLAAAEQMLVIYFELARQVRFPKNYDVSSDFTPEQGQAIQEFVTMFVGLATRRISEAIPNDELSKLTLVLRRLSFSIGRRGAEEAVHTYVGDTKKLIIEHLAKSNAAENGEGAEPDFEEGEADEGMSNDKK